MKPGYLIYHKTEDRGLYPAKVEKVGRKYLTYIDDDGKKQRAAISKCLTQNSWAIDQGIAKEMKTPGLMAPACGYPNECVDQRGDILKWVGICWIKTGTISGDLTNYHLLP